MKFISNDKVNEKNHIRKGGVFTYKILIIENKVINKSRRLVHIY